jgi:hypothetical protein
MARDRKRKGTFSPLRLSVADGYLRPVSRRRLLWLGGAAALVLAVLVLGDFSLRGGRSLSGGALSSSHAALQDDCASCHDPFTGVTALNCSTCHEKVGDRLGVYSPEAHYLYRSGDFQRVSQRENELSCAVCHVEHQGRDASITRIGDGPCLECHQFGSFGKDHPPFERKAEVTGIQFAHIHHVKELMERRGIFDAEQACLACHEPQPGGQHFEPIDFDRHCASCHLNGIATPRLPLQQEGQPGVETLATLRHRGGAGSSWTQFANPGEFREIGNRVMKLPVHHADPWILENLRHLRRRLYPEAGLADLLVTSAEGLPSEVGQLYLEAVSTLEEQAHALRSQPEPAVQKELDQIEILLREVELRLRDPFNPVDEGAFFLGLTNAPDEVRKAEVESTLELVTSLTQPCQPCHRVERATISRVRVEQQSFSRAEFNHRTHVLDRRCLDCHAEIPIAQALAGGEVDLDRDHSGIQNLPGIETCRECHSPQMVSSTCVTCHRFHPNQNHTGLLRYVH